MGDEEEDDDDSTEAQDARETQSHLERLALGLLLLSERRTKARLKKAVSQTIDVVSADVLGRLEGVTSGGRSRAAVLGALVTHSKTMAQSTQHAITESRQDARQASATRLVAELRAAGVPVDQPEAFDKAHRRYPDDVAHGTSAGTALAAAWLGGAMALTMRAFRKTPTARGIVGALKKSGTNIEKRSETTAITETSTAWSDEHTAALQDVLEDSPSFAAAFEDADIVRIWSAKLDGRTCQRCWGHHGEMVGVDEPFENGDEPGLLHPRCRCLVILVVRAYAYLFLEAA